MMRYILFVTGVLWLAGCTATPPVYKQEIIKETVIKEPVIQEKTVVVTPCEKPKPCKCPPVKKSPAPKPGKPIIGELERVYLPALDIVLEGRIDTGATGCSLDARNIVPFERDGKKWVRFEVMHKDKALVLKRPIVKTVKIKRHGQSAQERYVVKLRLNVAEISQFVNVSLTDRSQYKFPLLVGRNFLKGAAVVDVSKSYTKAPKKERP